MGFCTKLKKPELILCVNILSFSEILNSQLFDFPLTGWHYLKICKSHTETSAVIMEGLVRYSELKPILAISVLV